MHTIEIFHLEGQETVTLGSACSSCSGGCEPVTHNINDTIEAFNQSYSDDATIIRHILTENNQEAVATRLQTVYNDSGESLIITSSNIKYILSKLSPIIAIDNKLAANNYVPDADELKFALDNGNGIYSTLCP